MKTIIAYQVSDGQIFTSESKAIECQQNVIGEMLDDLVPDDGRGNITRVDRYNILTKMLENPDLADKINALAAALNHEGDETQ